LGIIGIIIAIVTATHKITRYITKVDDRITIEATRLDGRINQLEDRSDTARNELQIQRMEISKLKDYLLDNAQLLVNISEMSQRGKTNVEPDRTRKEKD
jgi:hypothetical protein